MFSRNPPPRRRAPHRHASARKPLAGLALVVLLFATGCAAPPPIPARGALAGEPVNTTVDSPAAACLLGAKADANSPRAARQCGLDATFARHDGLPLTRATLAALAEETSVDVAAIYFTRRMLADPRNARWQRALGREVGAIRRSGAFRAPAGAGGYLIVLVPGWLYRFQPGSGAGLVRELELFTRFGLRALRLDVDQNGTIESNARYIAGRIRLLSRSESKLILVSTSKAGAEVVTALGEILSAGETRAVKAWLSIGGLLGGTMIADDAQSWPRSWLAAVYFWWHGMATDSIASMTTARSRARLERVSLPPHILVLHYVAVPLSGQVSGASMDRYLRLRSQGPNDGLTLLSDELLPGGIVIVEPGEDHFYQDPLRDHKTLAFARLIIEALEARQ